MDVSEPDPKRTSVLLSEYRARLAAIVANSDDAIVSKNLNGIIESWNASAERIFGYTAEEAVGKPITIIIPPERLDEERIIIARLMAGERVDHFETVRCHKDGRRIDISVTISPIRDSTGKIVGASKIARDITQMKEVMREREQLLASEQAARREAERVNRVKDDFLATLSHELRTPLHAILGWAQLLKIGSRSEEDLHHAMEAIERNARTQTQLIDNLLDMSRIISGKLRLDVQSVRLQDVIEAAIESMRPAANAKQIQIITLMDSDIAPIRGDPNRLQQVIWNLLSNAIRHTPNNGRVQIRMQRVDSDVEVSVSDNGQGIEPGFIPHLFSRFAQAESPMTRKHSGLGLGLAIVRHLVELHGGTVRAFSAGPGQGATFTLSLPTLASVGDPEMPLSTFSDPIDHVDLSGLKILVVDDDSDSRALVRRVLEMRHATVITADSCKSGVESVRQARPDLIISDLGMPNEDGFDLLRKVRALGEEQGGRTPAIALTAFARPEDRRRVLLAGFQMHVTKPVETAELLAVVSSLCDSSRR